ncbi:peptidase M24A methionine aminopeptidase [Ephemerocybe angulata]|uniref:Methionine aminopeptidase 2 n=1 Tax=Ephemerocybe angulata TaxID=980116 RepID=A0A8H6IL79_9AGAR|nr:peptidase M24A methionine aminopeptidase [Tulosesus angulatus]
MPAAKKTEEQENLKAQKAQTAKERRRRKRKSPRRKRPVQSDPPRVGLSKIFPSGNYPVGEIQEYKDDNRWRTTSEEKRYAEKLAMEDPEVTYNNIRKAAEVHRVVRQQVRQWVKPGMAMTDIANMIEDGTRALVEENGLEAGVGFPTGLSLNNVAAHYSPNAGDKIILKKEDVMKVDIGVHVKGRICDSAFTLNFEPTYDTLLEAVRAATDTGVREAGIDVRVGELAGYIQETMESYEVEVNGKVFPVRPIDNITGHNIIPYQIHGGKSIAFVKNDDQTKMEEGEYFAYRNIRIDRKRLTSAQSLLKSINKNFSTLPFCRRYLDRAGEKNYLLAVTRYRRSYPPLVDIPGSMTAQYEHTILLRPTCKEVVSRGDDF